MKANHQRNRQIIRRRDEGQSYREIALAMGLTHNIVASVCRNAGMQQPKPVRAATAWPDGWNRKHNWVQTYKRLCFLYGVKQADAISEGRDVEASADLVAWRDIGTQRRAA